MQKVLLSMALASASLLAHAASDQFEWLEDVGGKKSLDWVKAQNATSRSMLEKEAGFAPLKNDVLDILNSKERIAYVNKMGGYFYNFWRDGEHPRGVWRRTTLASYKTANPEWETVLDLDALAKAENANWVYKGAECRYPEYDRCLISLSKGGADAVETREFDLNQKAFVKDGFSLPEAKSEISWQGKDAIFVATDFGKDSQTDSGYPRIVKLWQRGTPLASAKTIFEGQKTDISVSALVAEEPGFRREIIRRGVTFYTNETYLRSGDKLSRIAIPDDANVQFFGAQLLVTVKAAWTIGDKTWPSGSLLAINFDAFQAGKRDFTPLFTPSLSTSLNGLTATKNYLLIESLDNVKGRLTEWRFKDGQWAQRSVNAPAFGSIGATAIDADSSDDYFFTHADFLTPDSLYLAKAGSDERELLKQRPAFFDASKMEIAQNQAVSKDGTHVPYFIVKPKNLKLDANTPTLLYGYGGFEVSLTPYYSAGVGKAWLEKGGVYVLANIRGGGEFGPRWHLAALKENRQKAYDDFIAVAEDLISKKITQPKKLGIMGGSNGGLLMGVMMTQRPDLFGAVVCQVPLLDMRRFNKLLAGASWMGEYGNPDVPAEWDYISKYSPYQNIKVKTQYPNILFTTSTRDDRVHPGHARKMMAKMQSMGVKSAWYFENMEGGHAGAADNKQKADMTALEYSFLWKMLK
ncbi:prolyl oligopeptidase family serine peptidase [Iodobacter sp. CM08]|uniref:prolyl oligopeptidase family serine peptidase n=1 Tax=Iodobacter sp. CM08 TaxID=3085902 RepID=UPI0029812C69|nr:prolyl oligopeptidase family serine peptidase [Iodobacter sp. CM08]MDW5416833.1 prolyl oligopeptidase family serine peptidase [Iodobacter sp. CM08]